MESKHKKLQSLEVRHQREKTEVEERLGHEEAAVTALREEMNTKDQLLGKLRVSTKEVSEIQTWIQSMLFKLFILLPKNYVISILLKTYITLPFSLVLKIKT